MHGNFCNTNICYFGSLLNVKHTWWNFCPDLNLCYKCSSSVLYILLYVPWLTWDILTEISDIFLWYTYPSQQYCKWTLSAQQKILLWRNDLCYLRDIVSTNTLSTRLMLWRSCSSWFVRPLKTFSAFDAAADVLSVARCLILKSYQESNNYNNILHQNP